jgi:hypothetical protein
VFRELASRPIAITDYLLASAQGIGSCFVLYRTQAVQTHSGVGEILVNSLLIGPIAGVTSMFLFAVIYSRLGKRAGGKSSRDAVFHVLAYGGMPMVAALGLWALTALAAGDAAFVDAPANQIEDSVVVILRLQIIAHTFLVLWSLVLQVMGFSEIQGFPMGKAFGVWLLGQVLWLFALLSLFVLIALLFPGLIPLPAS